MKNTSKKKDTSLPLTEKGVAAFLSGKWVEGIGPTGEEEALHYAVGNTPASSRNSNF